MTKGINENQIADYYNQRLKNVNINPDDLVVRVNKEGPTGLFSIDMKVIEHNEKGGIDFFHVSPDGVLAEYIDKKKSNKTVNRWLPYKHTRKHPDEHKKHLEYNPKSPKVLATVGEKSFPWLTPITIKKSKAKEKIDALWIGEGAFKALSLQPHNICSIGLQGIQNTRYNDNGHKILHPFIEQTIDNCKPDFIIYFQDNDCRDIKEKVIYSDGKLDMLERSTSFYKAADNFQKAVMKNARRNNAQVFFVAIKKNVLEADPKGLDDLLQATRFMGREAEVINEIQQINKGRHRSEYKFFDVFNITRNTIKVKRWFCIHSHKDFAKLHIDEIEDTKCRFGHKIYFVEQDSEEKITLQLINDARVDQFMKIGTNYYKKCRIPFNDGQSFYYGRLKTDAATIKQQIGPRAASHIPLYDGYCNIPNYKNHQENIHGFFNIQSPLPYPIATTVDPKKNLTNILSLIDHISKNATVEYNGVKLEGRELLLDYLQLLLFHREGVAVQRLPFLCLVSEEQGTGKSTLGDFLIHELLGYNHIKIQNSDFSSDFNEPYATRRAVTIEEANFKKSDENRLKDLTGSDFILVNGKNDKQVPYANVLVLIMVSNDEKRFSYVSKDDTRHWVLKIDTLTTKDVNMKDKIREEIPFLYRYLLDRELFLLKLFPNQIDRYYFPPFTIRTKAWHKAVRFSMPKDCEPIRDYIEEVFSFLEEKKENITEIHYTAKDIRELVFEGKGDDRRVGEYLRDIFGLKYKSYNKRTGKPQNSRYEKVTIAGFDDKKTLYKTSNIAKCFIFPKKKFLTPRTVDSGVTNG